jgi:hypothetical protein
MPIPALDTPSGWVLWAGYMALFVGYLWPLMRAASARWLEPVMRRRAGVPEHLMAPTLMMPRRYRLALRLGQLWAFLVLYRLFMMGEPRDSGVAMAVMAWGGVFSATWWLGLAAERAAALSRRRIPRAIGSAAAGALPRRSASRDIARRQDSLPRAR